MPLGPNLGEPGIKFKKAKNKKKPVFYVPNAGSAFGIYSINKKDRRQVRQVQSVLRNLGIYKSSVDGIWGPQTERAWRLYSQPAKKGSKYGSLGTQVQNEKLLAKFHAEQAREIQQRYKKLEANLRKHRAAGDLDALSHSAALAQFWAGTGTAAGGVFAKTANQAKRQLKYIEDAQAQYKTSKAQAEAAAKKAQGGFLAKTFRGAGKALDIADKFTGIKTAGKLALKAFAFPSELVQRPLYATQLLENQRIERGEQSYTDFGATGFGDIAQSVIGTLGGRSLISSRVRGALEQTDDYEEREALRRAGKLESFGERTTRDFYAQLMSQFGDPKTKAALRNARSFKEATPGYDPSATFSSRTIDFGLQFLDPTIPLGGALKAASIVDNAVKATKLFHTSPSFVSSLTGSIADAAAKAALRDVGAGIGDVKFLQRLVPSLKSTARGETTELAAALVSTNPASAIRYLDDLAEGTDIASQAGKQAKALIDDALSKVKNGGMTREARQAILKASLGRTWKPRIRFTTRNVASGLSRINNPTTLAGIANLPSYTRQAKLTSITDLLGRGVKGGKTAYIGSAPANPEIGNLLRFSGRTAAEKKAAQDFLKTLKTKDFRVDVEVKGLANDIAKLPDSPLKQILETRLEQVDRKLKGAVGEAVQSTGDAALPQLKGVSAEIRKEVMQLRKETVGFTKLQQPTYEQAVYAFQTEMRDYAYMIGNKVDPRVSPWTKRVRAVARTFNDSVAAIVNLHDVNERAKSFRDYALALGGSVGDANSVYSRMARTMHSHEALDEAHQIGEGLVRNFFRNEGFTPDQVKEALAHIEANRSSFWRESEGWFSIVDNRSQQFKGKFNKAYNAEGATSPVVNSQLQYNWHMIDPTSLRQYVNMQRRKSGDWRAHVAAGASAFADGVVLGYQPLHRTFKFLALTLAAPRYILRVAAMEERLRMWMSHGFASTTEISSKYVRRLNWHNLDAGHGSRFFGGFEHVGIENLPVHLMDKPLIQVTGHGVIAKGERGFVENYWHVVHYQVRPEDDLLHHLLMPHLWDDEVAQAAARESAIEALETTKNGRIYLAKAKMVDKEYRDSAKLVKKTEDWLRENLPNQSIVDKRLKGQFSLSELRKNEEWWPEKTYGDKYQSLIRPRNPINWFSDVAGRLTIQTPTVSLNRQPFAWAEFNREFDSLVASGFTAERAQEMAANYAVRRTNEILYDATVRSRFAEKFDILFPFQQAREEVVRVWGKLIKENPTRAAKTLDLMATAFNNGVNNGVVTKDQYDAWQLTVPGNPALSRALGRWAPEWVPFKDGLTKLAESKYTFGLRSLLFVQDAWGATPRPGGPWWTALGNASIQAHPEWFPKNGFWQKYLFDERNPSTFFLRPEVTRLYIALTGKTFVPWEPLASFGIGGHEAMTEKLRDRMVGEVGAELYREWIANGSNPKEKPTPEDVANAVRAQLFMWGLVGMVVPASTRVTVPSADDFEDLKAEFTVNGTLDVGALLRNHPEYVGFIASRTKDIIREAYTNDNGEVDVERLKRDHPEYWERWKQRGSPYDEGPEAIINQLYSARDYLSPEEWVERIDQSRRVSQAWHEQHLILNSGATFAEREREMSAWETKYGDLDDAWGKRVRDYRRDLQFDSIMALPPAARATALQNWRYRFNVSVKEEAELLGDLKNGITSHKNPWIEARNSAELVHDWQANDEGLSSVRWAKKNLTLHEQLGFYNYLANYADDVQDWNDLRKAVGELIDKNYDKLFGDKSSRRLEETEKLAEEYWKDKRHDAGETIGKKYDQIGVISDQMDAAVKAKNWPVFYRLKDQRTRLFAEITGIKNSLYKKFPDLRSAADEVKLLRIVGKHGAKAIKDGRLDELGIGYLKSSEERSFDQMPPRIQQDYVDDLLERLTTKPKEYRTERGESSMKWEYLTEFQKDTLRDRLSERQLDTIKRMAAAREDGENGGFKKWGRRSGRWQLWGHTLGNGFGELTFALEQFKKYNRRAGMAKPTAELAEYAKLGDNAILKSQYIKSHPRLQAWFRAGPLANMPPVLQEIVRNIMVKYGKWESQDEAHSWSEISELGFAKEMLARYNKRTGQAPAALELWQNMPTGPKRFKYMQHHPEIEKWLQAGPMANMPKEYQEVVRDIMTRFGLWTKKTDPLSTLIQEYFQTPEYAKQQFLEENPEILAYWRAIRTGRDRQLFDLAQSYFAIADPEGKKAYIEAHPELLEYFINQRRDRYEAFLSQVARYLGQTPELAEHYLEDQTRFLKEMVDKFATRPLVPATVTNVTYGGPRQVQRQGQRERST